MDTWVKTKLKAPDGSRTGCFNPCFNGYMGKDKLAGETWLRYLAVSILVLMDTWVKTHRVKPPTSSASKFQSLF